MSRAPATTAAYGPPLRGVFTTNHDQPADHLWGTYKGASSLLICRGPSLDTTDLSPFERDQGRGLVVAAVNNVAAEKYRPHLWFGGDHPKMHHGRIFRDPGIMKFTRLSRRDVFTWVDDGRQKRADAVSLRNCPNTYFATYADGVVNDPNEFLHSDLFGWSVDPRGEHGRRLPFGSTMVFAIRTLYWLGFRTVALVGCDFTMLGNPAGDYANGQRKSSDHVRGVNENTLRLLNSFFTRARAHMDAAGFRVVNCTPGGNLTAFDRMTTAEAADMMTSDFPVSGGVNFEAPCGPHGKDVLHVGNNGREVGGTGACIRDLMQAVPGEHAAAYPGDLLGGGHRVAVWHNTRADRFDASVAERHVYVWHSAGGCADAAAPCDAEIFVSSHLQSLVGRDGSVVIQPVETPPSEVEQDLGQAMTVGRLTTPDARKWPDKLVEFYRKLDVELSDVDVRYEFVGCPRSRRQEFKAALGECVFHEASPDARRHLWRWDVLLAYQPFLTESFGRTVSEAQLARCIPIADRQGGFIEQVQHGVTGYLCGPRPCEFADAVRTVAAKRASREINAIRDAGRAAAWVRCGDLEAAGRRWAEAIRSDSK
ncbi:MAG: glycosyltransferase [Planctomycetota bacterium]